MILSRTTIQKNIEAGALKIVPFVEANLKEASYTFTLSPKLMSSTFAEPDTHNQQTLEIKNISKLPIHLLPKMHIVKGIFLPLG